MRSIGWGAELLESFQRDLTIPEDLRGEARRVAETYPSTGALIELLARSAHEFPASAGRSIEDARALFERVRSVGGGSADTRRDILYTMRHFPLAGWAQDAEFAARLGRLDDWLAPERP